jgi:hypothetical protein
VSVYQAISNVTAELARSGIGKTKRNAAQGFSYRGVDDVMQALAWALPRCGLVMLPRVVGRTERAAPSKSGGTIYSVILDVEWDLVSVVDGSRTVVRVHGEAMDAGDKATTKALSAAYKYAAVLAFSIPLEGIEDADAHSPEAGAAPAVVPAAVPMTCAQADFTTGIEALGFRAEDAEAFVVAKGRPHPAEMTSEQRRAVLDYLSTDKGKIELGRFIVSKESAS